LKLFSYQKCAVIFSIACLISALSSAISYAQEVNQSHSGFNIILDQERAPFSYKTKNGEVKGLMIDLWNLVGKQSHRKINFELLDLQHSLHKVKSSNNHVHGGTFDIDERDAPLLFSIPIFTVRSAVFVNNKKLFNALELADLENVVMGVTAGSYEEDFMHKHYPSIMLRIYNNQAQLVESAVRGDIDVFVVEYPVGIYYLTQRSSPDQFRTLSILSSREVRAAVSQGNVRLLADINQAIGQITEEDANEAIQKWIAQEQVEVVPDWIIVLVCGLFAIFALISWFIQIRFLRKKISNQKQQIFEQEKHVLLLTSNMSDWVWTLNQEFLFSYSSPSVNKLIGFTVDEILHKPLHLVFSLREIERLNSHIASIIAQAKRGEVKDVQDSTVLLDMTHKNGQNIWTEVAMRVFFDAYGNFTGAQGSSRNITERKHAEDVMRQMAFNDPLTQLPNRRLLVDRVQQAMAGCVRNNHYSALLFLDIDNFKYINDNYGHDNGDIILQQIALRFSSGLRESDTIARFGGDEFVIVSENLHQDFETAKQQALLIGIKTMELFDRPFFLREIECSVTASIGIALFNGDSRSANTVIKQADLAMYQAKAKGRNRVIISENTIEI